MWSANMRRWTHLPCTGIAISSLPKKSFWKPPGLPGCTTQATEGVSLPAELVRLKPSCKTGTVLQLGKEVQGLLFRVSAKLELLLFLAVWK